MDTSRRLTDNAMEVLIGLRSHSEPETFNELVGGGAEAPMYQPEGPDFWR